MTTPSVSARCSITRAKHPIWSSGVCADLDQDRVLSLALVQLCQILGEAASRVSAPRQQQHPEIPWAQVVALRNRLIHGYDTINLDILWQILTGDMPPLITALENIVPPKTP